MDMDASYMLKWYFNRVFEKAGLEWTNSNNEDIDNLVKKIKEETIQEMKRKNIL